MAAARTATPLLTTTLAIAAATAAILVGCSRHGATPASSDAAASSGAGIAYDPNTGGTTNAEASVSGFHQGDSQPGDAAGANTTGNAATGITQAGAMGASSVNGAPSSSSSPQ